MYAVANKLQRPIMAFSDGVSTRHLYMYKPDYPMEGWDVIAKEDVKSHLKTDTHLAQAWQSSAALPVRLVW